jgi:hypothetical protein
LSAIEDLAELDWVDPGKLYSELVAVLTEEPA